MNNLQNKKKYNENKEKKWARLCGGDYILF